MLFTFVVKTSWACKTQSYRAIIGSLHGLHSQHHCQITKSITPFLPLLQLQCMLRALWIPEHPMSNSNGRLRATDQLWSWSPFPSIDQCLQIRNWNNESTTKTKRQGSSYSSTKPVPKLLKIKKFQCCVVSHLQIHFILGCEYSWDLPPTSPNVYLAKFQFTLQILVEYSRFLSLATSAQWLLLTCH